MKELIVELLGIVWPFLKENPLVLILCAGIILFIIFVVRTILDELIRRVIRNNKKRDLYRKLGRAAKLVDRGYKIRADEMFAHVIEKGKDDIPLTTEAHKARSKAFMHPMAQDLELALNDANGAIKSDEKDGDAYIVRGRVYSLMGNHDKAIADFNKAYEFAITGKEESYLYRGIEYYIIEEYDEAVKNLRRAIRLRPKYAEALFYLGNTHYSKGEYKRAINDYTKAIKLNPKDAMVLNNCGCAYVSILDYNRAMKIYNKALKIEPYYPQAIRNRGLLHYDMGSYDKAIADYNMSFEAKMNYYKKLLKGWDKEEDGTEDFDSQEYKNWETEENKIDASILFKRGNAFAHKRDYDRAIDDYTQAIETNPDHDLLICILCNRANVYSLKNDFTYAIEDYNKALEIKPNHTWIINNLAATYYAIGDYERAIAGYKKAVEIDPNDGVARTNLFHAEEEEEKKIQEKKNGR
jgi:tetratricopeptide (TPR) repeat protein